MARLYFHMIIKKRKFNGKVFTIDDVPYTDKEEVQRLLDEYYKEN